MSLNLPCPNCGADVVFRSAALPARICDYCQTMLVRDDAGVAVVGKASPYPFDVSPVCIGMSGRFEEQAFNVSGRIRWAWTDGSWNEWYLLFNDGSGAWLGEAMGQFMLLKEQPIETVRGGTLSSVIDGRAAVPGTEIQLDNFKLTIVDAREVICLTSEGELPWVPKPGRQMYSVDLRGRAGECTSLQRDDDGSSLYQGRYVTLSELAPRGLRIIDGWTLPAYAA